MTPKEFCVNCGAPLEEGAAFCPSCGQRVDSLPEDAPAGDATEAEDAFAGEPASPPPPPPPPPPPSGGGLRPAASSGGSSTGGQSQPSRATPPPTGRARGQAGGGPPLGGSGGPAARPSFRPEEPKKKSKTGLYIAGGCGCLALLVLIIVAIVLVVRSYGTIVPSDIGGGSAEVTVVAERRPEVGEVLYTEDFDDPSSGWDVFSGDDQSVGYEGGRYVILVDRENWMTWGNAYERFDDGILITVEATKIGGPDDNGFGVVFGYQDKLNFYRFEIASDGYYRFGKYVDDEWIEIIPWTESTLVRQGNARNRISVEMREGTFVFGVNGEPLDKAQDGSFTGGDIGLVAGSFDTPGVEIAFDNIRVVELK
jgi:hypothetical protein